MKHFFILLLVLLASTAWAGPTVVIETNMGSIEVELDEKKAPITVKNFLSYVDSKFYDGTIFHRVIEDFMIQGGGMTPDMKEKPTKKPIKNEGSNGLKNTMGTIAMARTSEPHSATSQFFINVKDNSFLDYTSPDPSGAGYAVFGKVVNGMHVVERIKKVKTGSVSGHQDVPMDQVLIKSVTRKK